MNSAVGRGESSQLSASCSRRARRTVRVSSCARSPGSSLNALAFPVQTAALLEPCLAVRSWIAARSRGDAWNHSPVIRSAANVRCRLNSTM
jgi:hypothetical protein